MSYRAGNVSVCLHALRERLKEGEREVCFSLLPLYKLDSGTFGTIFSEEPPLKTLQFWLLSLFLFLPRSVSKAPLFVTIRLKSVMLCPHSFSDSRGSQFFSAWPTRASDTLALALPSF